MHPYSLIVQSALSACIARNGRRYSAARSVCRVVRLEGNARVELECASSDGGRGDRGHGGRNSPGRIGRIRTKGDRGVAIVPSAIGKSKARMVQDILSIYPKLQTDSFSEAKVLAQ